MSRLLFNLAFSTILSLLLTSESKSGIVDSLKDVIENSSPDSKRIKALLQLGDQFEFTSPDKSLKLYQQALSIAEDGNHLRLIAKCKNYIGIMYRRKSDYPRALQSYFQALEINQNLNNKKSIANNYNNIGLIYENQYDYALALDYYFKALDIYKDLEDKSTVLANTYNNIGIVYDYQSEFVLAIEYYLKALAIVEALGDIQSAAGSYTNIGSLYTAIYEKVQTLSYGTGDSMLNAIGLGAFTIPGLLDSAQYYQKHALSMQLELELRDEWTMSLTLSGIGLIHIKKKEYEKGIKKYQEAALIAHNLGSLRQESYAELGLVTCYDKLKNYKRAMEHHQRYSSLKDSVFNEERSKELGKIEAKHDFKTAEMERVRAEEDKMQFENAIKDRRDNLQYSGILIFLVLVFAGVFSLGKISIPIRLAEGLIFFSFLLFFEFTLVLLDPYIEQYSGGAPALKLGFNAVLAALIFPLHSLFDTKIKGWLVKSKDQPGNRYT